jgi:hypothetical protein
MHVTKPLTVTVLAALAAAVFLVFPADTARALPDEEVQAMVRESPVFRAAENRILRIWAGLPKDRKQRVRASQLEWIAVWRDEEAAALMRKGYSQAEAYAWVTDQRSDWLLGHPVRPDPPSLYDDGDFGDGGSYRDGGGGGYGDTGQLGTPDASPGYGQPGQASVPDISAACGRLSVGYRYVKGVTYGGLAGEETRSESFEVKSVDPPTGTASVQNLDNRCPVCFDDSGTYPCSAIP